MRYAFLKATTTMFSIGLLTACHAKTPSKPERDLNAIVEIPFGIPSLNQTTTLRIPEGYIDRWVMGEKIEPYPSFVMLETSGIKLQHRGEENKDNFKYPKAFTQLIRIKLKNSFFGKNSNLNRWEKDLSGEYIVKSDSCKFNEQKELRYGLHWGKVDLMSCVNSIANPQKVLAKETQPDKYFIRNNKEQTITSIWCLSGDFKDDGTYIDGTKTSNNPSCEHLTYDEKTNMYMEINYSRQFLPNWKEIQTNTLILVQNFLSKSKVK